MSCSRRRRRRFHPLPHCTICHAAGNTDDCRFHDAESLFGGSLRVNRRRGRMKGQECSTRLHVPARNTQRIVFFLIHPGHLGLEVLSYGE